MSGYYTYHHKRFLYTKPRPASGAFYSRQETKHSFSQQNTTNPCNKLKINIRLFIYTL